MIQRFREFHVRDRLGGISTMPSLLYMVGRERRGTGPQPEDIASPHKNGRGIG